MEIKMKKAVAAIAFGLSMVGAHAAGPFDGIYKDPELPDLYVSVTHGADNNITAAFFRSWAVDPAGLTPPVPKRIGTWWLLGGLASGNSVRVTGEDSLGFCNLTYQLTRLASGNLAVTEQPQTLTSHGAAQGAKCDTNTWTYEMPKIR